MLKSTLIIGARIGAHDTKNEYILDRIEFVISSTLRKEWRTEISKLVKHLALFCPIYVECVRNLVKEHYLAALKDLD